MSCVERPEIKWLAKQGFSSGASKTIARAGVIDKGDFLVLVAANGNHGALAQWPAKTGWTLALNGGSDQSGTDPDVKMGVYYRFADGTEGETETVTYVADGFSWSIAYLNFGQRVDPTTPIAFGTEVVVQTGTSNQVTVPGLVSPKDRNLGLLLAAYGADITVLPFAISQGGWTSRAEIVSTGVNDPTSLLVATWDGTDTDFEGETLPGTVVSSPTGVTERGWVGVMGYLNRRSGRTTGEILDELLKFLPPDYVEASDLLGGIAAQMSRMETDGGTLFDLATVSRGIEKWLTLHGQGLGFLRGPGETDDAYRERLRAIEDKVTRPAILAAMETILESRTTGVNVNGEMLEWYQGPCLGLAPFFLGTAGAALSPGPNSFIMVVEDFDNDDTFDEPEYNTIANMLNENRAAGVRAYMVLAPTVATLIPNRRGVLGWPPLLTVGDITSADRDGFDTFAAGVYGLLDIKRLSANNVKMYAIRFQLSDVLGADQVFLGSNGADGIALWLTTAGDLRLRIEDGVTSVDITLAAAMPIEVGVEWWVFLQVDKRVSASAVPGLVAIGRAGDANLSASQTFTPAAGVAHQTFASEVRIGRNTGGLSGSPTVSTTQMKILEIREYDAEADTSFSFTVPVVELILSGSNKRWDRIDAQWDGSDQVLV